MVKIITAFELITRQEEEMLLLVRNAPISLIDLTSEWKGTTEDWFGKVIALKKTHKAEWEAQRFIYAYEGED